ncbi:MAG: potassium channel family protein [Cellvibrionales bacterium]|nr:potassium channel family protein [Cellvibrionales bacterium]
MGRTFFFLKRLGRNKIAKSLAERSHKARLFRLFALLLGLVCLHTFLIQYFEALPIVDALWLTLTSMTTVGYGDFSASTIPGRLTTVLLIYVLGIWILAQLAGDFLEYRQERREKMIKGLWRWQTMPRHILIINAPEQNSERYLVRLVEQIQHTPSLESYPVNILTSRYPEGLPASLRDKGVKHFHRDVHTQVNVDALHIDQAAFVLVLAPNEHDARSDSLTLDMLDRLQREEISAFVVAECLLDENRERFLSLGAGAVIRPVRGYPELVVRAMSAPGTERILENLFTHQGASTKRVDIHLSGLQWKQIVSRLIDKGLGTALGFIDNQNHVITNPNAHEVVHGSALLLMVSDANPITTDQVKNALVEETH